MQRQNQNRELIIPITTKELIHPPKKGILEKLYPPAAANYHQTERERLQTVRTLAESFVTNNKVKYEREKTEQEREKTNQANAKANMEQFSSLATIESQNNHT